MTTTQQPTLFAEAVIKLTSAYFQTKPLNIWAKNIHIQTLPDD
jgi:hypothetical protein